jgi:hypothetical protein
VGSIDIAVIPGVPSVVWDCATDAVFEMVLNAKEYCNAYVNLEGGEFIYDPPIGTMLAAGEHVKLSLTYIPDDPVNYETVNLTRYIHIDRRLPIIQWDCPAKMHYGQAISKTELCACLSHTENSADTLEQVAGGEFTYSVALGVFPPAGKDLLIEMTFIPPEAARCNYLTVTSTRLIQVLRLTPQIKWKPKQSAITHGKPLDGTLHCNAVIVQKSLCPGICEYTPPIETLLSKGKHSVEMHYIPLYPENCHEVFLTHTFEVTKKPPMIVWEKDPLNGKLRARKVDS